MRRLPKQLYLLVAAAVVLGFLLRQVDRQTSDANITILEAELIQSIPTIPNLAGWPQGFLDELKNVHGEFQDTDGKLSALASLGELYLANGFYGEARQCFTSLVVLDSENPRWPYFLGITTRDYSDKRIAIDAFERAIRLTGDYLNIRYELGSTYVASGHILDSELHFLALNEVDEWKPWARFGLARGYAAEGRYREAKEQLEMAISRENEARSIFALLNEAAIAKGDRALASEARSKRDSLAFDKTPYDPWIQSLWSRCFDPIRLTRLALAEVLNGDRQQAAQIIERAESVAELPESIEVEALIELLEQRD